jgi:adenine-specific DNA-methyltransferase
LRDDGVIFVSIDDNEVHHLRTIMNEIFGEENFVSMIVWNSSTAGGIRPKHISQTHEYAIMFAKSKELLGELFAPLSEEATQQYQLRDDRGLYREKDFAWRNNSNNVNQKYGIPAPDGSMLYPGEGYIYRFVRSTFENALANDMVVFKYTKTSPLVDGNGDRARYNIYIKKYLGFGKGAPSSIPPRSIVGLSNRGAEEVKNLFDGLLVFNNPKSVEYLKYLIEIGTDESSSNDIILDFFAGSGSTAHAVMAQNAVDDGNRKFILVQFPEPLDPANNNQKTAAEFCDSLGKPRTIAEITKERVRRAAAKIRNEHPMFVGDVGFQAFKLADSHIRPLVRRTYADGEMQAAMDDMFAKRLTEGWSVDGLASELLLREGFPLTSTYTVVNGWRVYTSDEVGYPLYINLSDSVTDVAQFVAHLAQRGRVGVNKRHGVAICQDDAISTTDRVNVAEYVTVKTL